MIDDILTRLTHDIAFRLRLQAKVSNLYQIQHPHMVRIPTIYEEAADEIEDLRAELEEFRRQFRALQAERDQWQTKAVSHD